MAPSPSIFTIRPRLRPMRTAQERLELLAAGANSRSPTRTSISVDRTPSQNEHGGQLRLGHGGHRSQI